MSVAEVLHNSPGFNIWALHLGRLHFMETMLRHEQDLQTHVEMPSQQAEKPAFCGG